MTDLLLKLFFKEYKEARKNCKGTSSIAIIPDENGRLKLGVLSGIVGIVLNVILAAGKFFAGILSGSISIVADAFNNLSDAG